MEKDVREAIKRFCNAFSNPTAIMDNTFMCLYSNSPKLLPHNQTMIGVFQKTLYLPLKTVHNTMAMIDGCIYSVRIIPFEEDTCICEFFSAKTIMDLAENSDIYDKILPIVNELDYDIASMWRGYAVLCSKLDDEDRSEDKIRALEIEKYLTRLNSAVNNISEYVNIMFNSSAPNFPIDINTMLEGLIGRCNTILSESGRYIDFVSEPGAIYISSQIRFVMSAVVNALQNALLYSPRDCFPYVTLSKQNSCFESGNVLLKILNDSVMHVEHSFDGDPEWDFHSQRLGFGIPIIKRFAEMSGGSFSLTEENGKVCVVISLPIVEAPYDSQGIGVLNSSRYVYYKTDIPDILDLKMREVNMLFGDQPLFS